MRHEAPFILFQVARFGALTIAQVRELCVERCRRTAVYECLRSLIQANFVERIWHPTHPQGIYRITPQGFEEAFGRASDFSRQAKGASIKHMGRVTETLFDLTCYEKITGFATEFEIPTEAWAEFSRSKIPDAIIQVTRDGKRFELAVEVECEAKTWARTQEFLSKYRDAFEQRALCSGVILICDEEHIFNRYQTLLREAGESLAKRFLVLRGPKIPTLNPALYGEPRNNRGFSADRARVPSVDGIQYLPIKSIQTSLKSNALSLRNHGVVKNIENKENLQPISQ